MAEFSLGCGEGTVSSAPESCFGRLFATTVPILAVEVLLVGPEVGFGLYTDPKINLLILVKKCNLTLK